MGKIIELEPLQVLISFAFVLMVLAIARRRGIRRDKEILVSSVRMTIQLILTGYVLAYILENPNPLVTAAIIILMECFAVFTVFNKFKGKLSGRLKTVIALSLATSTLVCMLFFLFIIVRISPWYDPRYFIPIAGMFIGNSMTGIALGVKSLTESMTLQKNVVEESLILGATPREATRPIINSTFDAAIMPTINSMVGMGIVFLPGMMTGQILSGTAPTTAVTYQIAIMFGILGAVALSVILMLQFGYRTYFNDEDQLV